VDYFTTKYDFGSDGVESNTAPKSTSPSLQSGTPQRGELGLVEYEWKTLGEVGEFKYGFTDKALDEGNTRFVRITDINGNGKLIAEDSKYINLNEANKDYLLQKGDVLMARTGATFGKTMLFNEDYSSIYASFLIRLRFERSLILPNFYWHFAQSNLYWEQANKLVGGGAQPQFNANVLKLVKIPIPPLLEQERIVSILDKFDALVNDISIGLPAELKARRKQYEYYRNQLLSFREYASK
jgi:type I restriction enzyme S subunit